MTFVPKLRHSFIFHLGAAVCVLCLTVSPASFAQSALAGVYTGSFSGAADSGQFAILVRTNSTAVVMGYDNFDEFRRQGAEVDLSWNVEAITSEMASLTTA